MPGGRAALVISVVAHAALFAVATRIVVHGTHVIAVVPAHVVGSEPAPIDVVVIDSVAPSDVRPATSAPASASVAASPARDGAPSRQAAPPRDRATAPSRAAISTTAEASHAPSSATGGEGRDVGAAAPTPGLLHMRGPDLALAPGAAEQIAAGGGTYLAPTEPTKSGKLENVPGGGAVIHDRVTTVAVERDGSAHFHDKPDVDLKLKLPIPHLDFQGMRKDLGKALTDWYADPYKATRFGRMQDLPRHLQASPGACDSWGSVWCDDPLAPDAEKYVRDQKKTNGSILGGPADLSAYLQRKLVGDPFASRKLKLLDDTRDERVALGTAFRAQQLVRSAELIERNLARLAGARLSIPELHEVLFELWDECDEGEGPEGQAGQRARAQVVGWIGAHLPKGAPGAFSDEEIARFDARRASKQRFFPY